MKRYIKYVAIVLAVMLVIIIGTTINKNNQEEKQEDGKFKIVTSFYPVYIMTANITQGANNIELVNMADTNVGCIHNYTLSTEDMKKVENTDVFIENGLGLENFIDKVTSSNKNLQIIDSSANIMNLIKEENETNPHIWTSLSNYIEQVKNISNALIEKNPENTEIYIKNTENYIKRLADLKLRFDTELQGLNGKSAIVLNESFEYLTRDAKMKITTIHTDHEESTISAETLKNIIDEMKQNQIEIIIVDINDNIKNAETIANETGAKIYKLDSGLTGSLSKDSYLNSMNGNLNTLKNAINEQ